MREKLLGLLSGLVVYALSAGTAQALIIQGDFLGVFSDSPPVPAPITTVSGSFQASFDDSVVTGVGFEDFDDLQILTSFSLTPNPFGATIFDTSNVGLRLIYNDGLLTTVDLGGLIDGVATMCACADDFIVSYGPTIQTTWLYYTVANPGIDFYQAIESSGSYTTTTGVPAPPILALFGIGLAGIGSARNKLER